MSRIALLLALATAACTSTPSGASCPPEQAPTYEGFARPFMTTYCTGCHSANATDRHGAPGDQNYDTEADLKQHAADIDAEAAAGPNAMNTAMPELSGPVHVQPSREEREMLGQYLACVQP